VFLKEKNKLSRGSWLDNVHIFRCEGVKLLLAIVMMKEVTI